MRARVLSLHVAEAGFGEDVVLCLHGWPQHWCEWRHLMPALADHHRVLALDLRGFGWSDAQRRGYEKENMATDVLTVLDELSLERVKLVGHDWGGWIGFLLGLRSPQRVERFLALNIVPPWVSLRSTVGSAWRFLVPADDPGAGSRRWATSAWRLCSARPGRGFRAQGCLGPRDASSLCRQPR